MFNIFAAILVTTTYFLWGLWLIDRRWASETDLDGGFFWSVIPVAIATCYALYLVGA